MLDHDTSPWVKELKEEATVTPGFERDIPPYVSEFLIRQIDKLRQAVLCGNKKQLMEILVNFTDSIPRETQANAFEELFFGLFFTAEGKPHLSIVKGRREKVGGEDVKAADLDFPEAPADTTGLILIHTHPKDLLIGLSDSDNKAFSGIFSQRLKLFPNLNNAYIGLCTANRPENVLLFEAESWGGVKYFSKGILDKRP